MSAWVFLLPYVSKLVARSLLFVKRQLAFPLQLRMVLGRALPYQPRECSTVELRQRWRTFYRGRTSQRSWVLNDISRNVRDVPQISTYYDDARYAQQA
jgi:hypothetical protein